MPAPVECGTEAPPPADPAVGCPDGVLIGADIGRGAAEFWDRLEEPPKKYGMNDIRWR